LRDDAIASILCYEIVQKEIVARLLNPDPNVIGAARQGADGVAFQEVGYEGRVGEPGKNDAPSRTSCPEIPHDISADLPSTKAIKKHPIASNVLYGIVEETTGPETTGPNEKTMDTLATGAIIVNLATKHLHQVRGTNADAYGHEAPDFQPLDSDSQAIGAARSDAIATTN